MRRPAWRQRLALSPDQADAISPMALLRRSARRPAIYIAASPPHYDDARAFADRAGSLKLDVTLGLFPRLRHADFVRGFAVPANGVSSAVERFLSAHRMCR